MGDAGSGWIFPRHDTCPSRGTHGTRRIGRVEAHGIYGKLIEVWCLVEGASIVTHIHPAEIIDENEQYIGAVRLRVGVSRGQKQCRENVKMNVLIIAQNEVTVVLFSLIIRLIDSVVLKSSSQVLHRFRVLVWNFNLREVGFVGLAGWSRGILWIRLRYWVLHLSGGREWPGRSHLHRKGCRYREPRLVV